MPRTRRPIQVTSALRPVKFLLPVDVIRRMDQAILEGLGGYTNRHDFARDALENHALEMLYGEYADAGASAAPNGRQRDGDSTTGEGSLRAANDDAVQLPLDRSVQRAATQPRASDAATPLSDASETALQPVPRALAVENQVAAVRAEPLIGLHNRDWPSLWALARLAELCSHEPQPLRIAYGRVTEEAWSLSRSLAPLEAGGVKLRGLLPSNEAKPHSAEEGFQAFAIGSVNRRPDEQGKLIASGALYVWQALGLVGSPSDPKVGVTESGWELLRLVEGLTVLPPHAEEHARSFLAFLRVHAPADWFGFELMLECASQRVGRIALGECFRDARDWKESIATSTAQGYLARSREWGLVEPKLVDGVYELTSFGAKVHASPPEPRVGRGSRQRGKRSRAGAGRRG